MSILCATEATGYSTFISLDDRQKRIEKTAMFAKLSFDPEKQSSVAIFGQFPLFMGTKIRYRENTVTKLIEGVKIEITDIVATQGAQLTEKNMQVTVILLSKLPVQLADFVLEKEDIFDIIKELSGYNDIDFKNHPKFSSHYLLKSRHKEEVRAVFNRDLIALMEENLNYYIECKNNNLLVHNNLELLDGNDYSEALRFSEKLLENLQKVSAH